MSIFRKLRVYPNHGSRSSVITWEMSADAAAGLVYVAFSTTGTPNSWTVLNPADGVAATASATLMYNDARLDMNSGASMGFYRLLLTTSANVDFFSEKFSITGDLTPKEYGMVRGIMHREFLEMRACNGYPVWHCIPKESGTAAPNVDPDTGEVVGLECANVDEDLASFGLPILGGFHTPVLTWIRALAIDRGTLKDSEGDMSPRETDTTTIRMLAFPQPSRGHMIVDPATDRRYLIGDEIKPFLLRGVLPIAYETTMQFLSQGDPRYRFVLPDIDTKDYRRIPYWSTP